MSDERRAPEPSDPAGTQPRVDRDALLPARRALWSGAPPIEPPAGGAVVPAQFPDDDDGALAGDGGAALVPAPRKLKYHEAPHAPKFQFLLGALLAVAGIAIVSVVLLVSGSGDGGDESAAGWSSWAPAADGEDGAAEIAAHVQPQYRTEKGELAFVEVESPEIYDLSLDPVLRDGSGDVTRLEGDTLYYRVCGMGASCALPGEPSTSLSLLLQREALELALYSFRYLRGVDHVVLYLPPATAKVGTGKDARDVTLENQMAHYSRADLEPLLARPLAESLPTPAPRVAGYEKRPEAKLVASLAEQARYAFSYVRGSGDEEVFLLLEKLTPEQLDERQQAAKAQAVAAAGAATGSGG